MKNCFYYIVGALFLVGCQDFYRNTQSNLVFLEIKKENEVYLIDESSDVYCRGIVESNNNSRDIQYFYKNIRVSSSQIDTCQGFYLKDQLDGEYLVLSYDKTISSDDYRSYLNYYIPFDFNHDSVYVLEQISGDIFGRIETPQIGCYEMGIDYCSCDEFHSRSEYDILKELSTDSIQLGNSIFLKTNKISRIKIKRIIKKGN